MAQSLAHLALQSCEFTPDFRHGAYFKKLKRKITMHTKLKDKRNCKFRKHLKRIIADLKKSQTYSET